MCLKEFVPTNNRALVCSSYCKRIYKNRKYYIGLYPSQLKFENERKIKNANRRKNKTDVRSLAIAAGFRSGLEQKVDKILVQNDMGFVYEPYKIPFIQPELKRNYLPDFYIPEYDIYIEAKGRLTSDDRKKHILLKDQHPDKVILMVFGQADNKIDKRSSTTYAQWCKKNNIPYTSIQELEEKSFEEIVCQYLITKQPKLGNLKMLLKTKKKHS